jgi:hypothetical protein
MALQVSGYTVVNNSRNLTNITGVDATTAAAISAGGVGGGGEQTFTAAAAVSTGDIVGLRSDGKVQTMETLDTAGSEESASAFTGIFMGSSYQPMYNEIKFNHDNTRVLWLTAVQTTSSYYGNAGYYVCGGSVASDGTITWGTRSLIYQMSNAPGYAGAIEYIPTDNNTWAVSVNNQGATNSYLKTWAIQVSSSGALTIGTPYQVTSYNSYGHMMDVFPTGQIIITYNANSAGTRQRFRALSVSGTTLTAGTQYTIDANTLANAAVSVNPNTGKFVIATQVSSGKHYVVGTVSGTTLSYTTTTLSGSWSATAHGSQWLSDTDFWEGSTQYVYRINASNTVSELVSSVTTLEKPENVHSYYGFPSNYGMDYDTYELWAIGFATSTSRFVLLKQNYNGDGTFSLAFNPIQVNSSFDTASLSYYRSTYSGDGKIALGQVWYNTSTYNTVRSDIHIFNKGDFVNDAFVGIAKENISANSTGKIAVSGGTAGGLSNLNIGKSYGINLSSGSLFATLDNAKAIAISSTSVLLF